MRGAERSRAATSFVAARRYLVAPTLERAAKAAMPTIDKIAFVLVSFSEQLVETGCCPHRAP
jgi:hypothetical protein